MIAQLKLPVNSAYGATAAKKCRKTVSAYHYGEAVYCTQHEPHSGLLILCAALPSQPTRGAWRQSIVLDGLYHAGDIATYTQCVEAK